MISRRLPMESVKKSSFSDLVRYITDKQGKAERVAEVQITNCQSQDVRWAIGEVLATQQQNTRAVGDRTYHLLISFAPGEKPSLEVRRDIEQRLCEAMGYGEHQRISALHSDTDALHIHVAINKIHPTKFTMHEPYRDFKTRSAMCAKLEREHNLVQVNHQGKKHLSENRADDMERHSGVESLLSWVRKECLSDLKQASSWGELHKVLLTNGLEIRERANGLVIESHDGVRIKASTVDRSFSKGKLEARLGEFAPRVAKDGVATVALPSRQLPKPGIGKVGSKPPANRRNSLQSISTIESLALEPRKRYRKRPLLGQADSELYSQYVVENKNSADWKRRELVTARSERDRLIEDAKRVGRLKRAAIKLMGDSALNKRLLYSLVHKDLQEKLQKIRTDHASSQTRLHETYKSRTWADWLQAKALEGNAFALQALRERGVAKGFKDRTLAAKGSVANASVAGTAVVRNGVVQDHITKEGTVIYRAGSSAIRDDGASLQLSRGTNKDGVETALRMAVARFGREIKVTGSDKFKELVVRTAVLQNLSITFEDAAMESRRRHLQILTNQGDGHDRRNQNERRIERRRTDRTSTRTDGSVLAKQRSTTRGADAGGAAVGGTAAGRLEHAVRNRLASRAARERAIYAAGAGNTGSGERSESVRSTTGRPVPQHRPGVSRQGSPTGGADGMREVPELGVVHNANGSQSILPGALHDGVERQGAASLDVLRRAIHRSGGLKPRTPLPTKVENFAAKPGIGQVGAKPPDSNRARLKPLSSLQELKLSSGNILPQVQKTDVRQGGAGLRGPAIPVRDTQVTHPAKPGIGRVGEKPPVSGRDPLRAVSSVQELGLNAPSGAIFVATAAAETPVVSPAVTAERPHGVRKAPVITPKRAALAYVKEREEKRLKGFDIPKHRLYNQSDEGQMVFAGVRNLDGYSMTLLKKNEEILVLPTDEYTTRRMKRLKVGIPITVTGDGTIKYKGRSR